MGAEQTLKEKIVLCDTKADLVANNLINYPSNSFSPEDIAECANWARLATYYRERLKQLREY